ncbi:hypothetical protein [Bacillus pseudomycoides]|nr:hypothetical protein [Bacillus pseudomycoides]
MVSALLFNVPLTAKAETVQQPSPTVIQKSIQNGWEIVGDKWYYYVNGTKQLDWQLIDGVWYYFDASRAMVTGWQSISGNWYYFNPNSDGNKGAMVTGWKFIDGKWYYFNPNSEKSNGVMLTGWQSIDGIWYYFEDSGAMVTGWHAINGAWYYFNPTSDGNKGAMVTGWQSIGGLWYYLETSGVMVTGWKTIDGNKYYFSESGTWIENKEGIDNGITTVNKEINYPGNNVAQTKQKEIYIEQKPVRDALFGKTQYSSNARSFSSPGIFWPEPGDILLTTDTSPSIKGFGILGHVGMMLDPMTVMHIGGFGQTPQWMPSNGWFERYHQTVLLRWKNRDQAKEAAQWVWDHYIVGPGKNTDYRISPNVYNTNTTYCSELVYQGFLYGAQVHLLNAPTEMLGVVKPYDFLYMDGFTAVKLPY